MKLYLIRFITIIACFVVGFAISDVINGFLNWREKKENEKRKKDSK